MLCEIFQLSILSNILTNSPLFRYKVIFPYFWYPFKNVVTSGCVFMVVAVAAERYFAICKPLTLKPKPIFFIRLVTFHSVNIYWFFCCSDFTWNQCTLTEITSKFSSYRAYEINCRSRCSTNWFYIKSDSAEKLLNFYTAHFCS